MGERAVAVVLIVCIFMTVILFSGEPDLKDAFIHLLMK